MPHLHSPEARLRRRERAAAHGFLQPKTSGYTYVAVPDSVVQATRAASRSLDLHRRHDLACARVHHHGRLATLAAVQSGSIGDVEARAGFTAHRAAGRLKHAISAKRGAELKDPLQEFDPWAIYTRSWTASTATNASTTTSSTSGCSLASGDAWAHYRGLGAAVFSAANDGAADADSENPPAPSRTDGEGVDSRRVPAELGGAAATLGHSSASSTGCPACAALRGVPAASSGAPLSPATGGLLLAVVGDPMAVALFAKQLGFGLLPVPAAPVSSQPAPEAAEREGRGNGVEHHDLTACDSSDDRAATAQTEGIEGSQIANSSLGDGRQQAQTDVQDSSSTCSSTEPFVDGHNMETVTTTEAAVQAFIPNSAADAQRQAVIAHMSAKLDDFLVKHENR